MCVLVLPDQFITIWQVRLKKEQEEKEDKRRYKAQAHLFTIIKVCFSSLNRPDHMFLGVLEWSFDTVATNISLLTWKVARDQDLKEQIGKDIYFDLVDHDKVRSFRIQKQTPFQQFKVLAWVFFLFSFSRKKINYIYWEMDYVKIVFLEFWFYLKEE